MYLNETTAVLFDRLRMLLKLYHEHLNIASIRKKLYVFSLKKKKNIDPSKKNYTSFHFRKKMSILIHRSINKYRGFMISKENNVLFFLS